MQKIILTTCGLLLFTTLQLEASGKPSGCSTYVSCAQNVKDGPDNCTHPNDKNKIMIKANRKNGKLEGDFSCLKESGDPHVRVKFKNDEYDGLYEEYDSSLKDWGTATRYKNGKREGVQTCKLSEGRKVIRHYKNDKEHGFELILDGKNQIQSLSDCEIDNVRQDNAACEKIYIPGYESLQKTHFENLAAAKKADDNKTVERKFKNGNTSVRYKLVDGKIEGSHEEFYENGKPSVTKKYKAGKILELKSYFDDGQLKSTAIYGDSRFPNSEANYYQNGKIKSEYKYSSPDKWITRTEYKEYHDNGKLAEEGVRLGHAASWNSYGKPEGEIKAYAREGDLIAISNYKDGKLDGLQVRYYEEETNNSVYAKGVLVEETILDPKTKKTKSHKTFFPDGSVKSENKN